MKGGRRTVVLRSEIEKALDDLISNEEGMRFKGLGVILARQRWPELVACEGKKDLGGAAVGGSVALAGSLSGSLKKIRDESTEIKKHFRGVEKLVFATPAKVTNTTAQSWKEEIQKEFGYELAMIPRED